MTSLAQLLAKEGFKNKKKPKSNQGRPAVLLPNDRGKGLPAVVNRHRLSRQEASEDEAIAAVRAGARRSVTETKDGSHHLSASASSSSSMGTSHVKQRTAAVLPSTLSSARDYSTRALPNDGQASKTASTGKVTKKGTNISAISSKPQLAVATTKPAAAATNGPEPPPAIHEAAVGAVVSICNSYIRRYFLRQHHLDDDGDRSSRPSLRRTCEASLLAGLIHDHHADDRAADANGSVIANLTEAMDVVDRYIHEAGRGKEKEGEQHHPKATTKGMMALRRQSSASVKRAAIQLSVIGGMTTHDDDLRTRGSTSGLPNCHIAATAHIYLAVLCHLQGKPTASAKNLLQVFCDAPAPARTGPLRGLWEYLIAPHLSHLKHWYHESSAAQLDDDNDGLAESPRPAQQVITQDWERRLLLDRAYNEGLDDGTYRLALYYKQWVMTAASGDDDPAQGPEMPTIPIPRLPTSNAATTAAASAIPAAVKTRIFSRPPSSKYSFDGRATSTNSPTTTSSVSSPSASMVSRKLYSSVFSRSRGSDYSVHSNDREGVILDVVYCDVIPQCSEIEEVEAEPPQIWEQRTGTTSRTTIQNHAYRSNLQIDGLIREQQHSTASETDAVDRNMELEGVDVLLFSSNPSCCGPWTPFLDTPTQNQLVLRELAQSIFLMEVNQGQS